MSAPNEATLRQHQAADPGSSTWLSANAGSGKTRVLTDRVARLLLQGVPPENILCLTYTKAAAGEMQNRLFDRLGDWAMMQDAMLLNTLEDRGVLGPVDLARARTLFARAIETPGGLKIQTIHSFCAALLRQFPLEAGVSPRFQEMDDSAEAHLLSEVLDKLAEEDPGGAVSGLAEVFRGDDITRLAREITGNRGAFADEPSLGDILAEYGIPESAGPDYPLSVAFDGTEAALFASALPVIASGTKTMAALAETLSRVNLDHPGQGDLQLLYGAFLYKNGPSFRPEPKLKSVPTAKVQDALGALLQPFQEFMERVAAARQAELSLAAAERTYALRRFARALIPAYEAGKRARGWLDFDDLIEGARALLEDKAASDWVRYRLDGRIDHVLVDEAQDTSPTQWRVIEGLTAEFGAGEGAADEDRRLFVVGDKKQSIYSFQGADAEMFDEMRGTFRDRLRASGGMRALELQYSFRSSPAILQAVDAVFEGEAGEGLGRDTRHLAFFERMPGRVDLWPIVEKEETPDPAAWYDPVDMPAPGNPAERLADGIAAELHRLIHVEGETIPAQDGTRRPMTEGDVLILVQGRSGANDLFPAIIRALKERELKVAGADRLKIASELAVRDLQALLKFLALPEDDLSLAAALRSPIFGWSEDDLYRLAAGREKKPYLWQVLRDAPERDQINTILGDLRKWADFLRPYDLLERILVRHGARTRLLARLGTEAEDGIDELLNQALAYERQEIPSLTGFLGWLEGEATEVKRQADSAAGMIQVMTVHGAKGLERPVVILPDTLRLERNARDTVLLDPDGRAHWRTSKDEAPERIAAELEASARRERMERQRLLYVAMTRAESWLMVAGAGQEPKEAATWYGHVRDALQRCEAVETEMPTGTGLRFETGDWGAGDLKAKEPPARPAVDLPDWANQPASTPDPAAGTRAPSDLGGSKALPGEPAGTPDEQDPDAPLRRGRQVHLLLEHLPGVAPEARPDLATALLAFGEDAAAEPEARQLAAEVGRLVDDPELSDLFGPDSLAEVDITAALPELGRTRIHGAIDRLVIGPDRVLAVDFKTNRVVPTGPDDVPEGLLRQMGAYLSALRQIYPGRRVDVALLWTATGTLMPLPHDIVMDALARTPAS